MGDGARKAVAMTAKGMRTIAAVAGALMLAGCAGSSGPEPLTQGQLDAFSAAYVPGETRVGEALALAPAGTVGLIEVHVSDAAGAVEHATYGSPPDSFHDWLVVGVCGTPGVLPSIEVAAVPPAQEEAVASAPGFHLECDGPPAEPADG